MQRSKIRSFDNIISARKQCRRQFEAERLGGLEVDEQLNFCGLLDGQIGPVHRLYAPAGRNAEPTDGCRTTAAIGDATPSRDELAKSADRGDRVAESRGGEVGAVAEEERIGANHESTRAQSGH